MPRVAVIIPNYNGAALLPGCLEALRRQTFKDFVTVVVDNGSTDTSVDLVRTRFPEVVVIALPHNLGFAGAVNRGILETESEFVALLNNDAEPEPGWLEALVAALNARPEAAMAASKLLLYDRRDVLHSAGDFLEASGRPGNRGVWQRDWGQFDGVDEVFSACGAAALYRRSLFAEVGLFDEAYRAYLEDIDLACRARLRGRRCIYVPSARVYHRLSATGGGPLAAHLFGRNLPRLIVKNFPGRLLAKAWPAIAAYQLGIILESLVHIREPAARAKLCGLIAGWLGLPALLSARRQARTSRLDPSGLLASLGRPQVDFARSTYHSDVDVSVVIPAYNEAERIPETLSQVVKYLDGLGRTYEVLVVDDGSTDGTASLVAEFARESGAAVRVIRRPHAGKGAAVRAGMLAARGRFRLLCDADLSMPADGFDRFIPLLEAGVPVVIGSREVPGAHRYNEPAHRHLMGRVYNRIIQLLVLPGIEDTQCGFKGFRAEAALELFGRQTLDGFGFDVEILFIARRLGYTVREVPVEWYYMPGSKVKPLRDTWRMFRDALRVRLNALCGRYDGLPRD